MTNPFQSLEELLHIDCTHLCGRAIMLAPLWDGDKWTTWVSAEDSNFLKLSIVEVLRSNY